MMGGELRTVPLEACRLGAEVMALRVGGVYYHALIDSR
jgi:hypothetical protein